MPDYQGLGIAFALLDTLGAMYKAQNRGFHMYPAHPALIRAFSASKLWALKKASGTMHKRSGNMKMGSARPNATFSYIGPAANIDL